MILNIFDNKYVSDSFLKKVASKTFDSLNVSKDFIVNLSFVSEKKIKELNKRYRGEDRVTDVLSFKADFDSPQFLGDILICYPVGRRNAERLHKTVGSEIALLLAHGLLHLFSYNHDKDKEAQQMKEKETEILNSLKIE